jgi:hypothetical protein
MAEPDQRRYRFGPLERRGVIGSFRATQVLLVGGAVGVAVILIRSAATPAGVVAAFGLIAAATIAAFFPIAGRSAEEWAPVAASAALRHLTGRHRYRSKTPTSGVRARPEGCVEPTLSLPDCLRGLELLSAPLAGEKVGIVKDHGAKTYTGVLAASVASFGLLDRAEQERRIASWGWILAGLASEGSPVSRVQWIERTAPVDGDEIGRYLNEAWDRAHVPADGSVMSSYLELIDHAGAATQDHELLVCVQVDARRGGRQMKKLGQHEGLDTGACALLIRELEAVGDRLAAADVAVDGVLRPRMLARAIRLAYDPYARPLFTGRRDEDVDSGGVAPSAAFPTAADTSWGCYRTDGAVHATAWIAGWPRSDVGVSFLAPLLMHTTTLRTVSVTMEPVPPSRAFREAESARTADAADDELRRRHGFLPTARRRKVVESAVRREQELADGHASIRFAGYVTVSARDENQLERSFVEVSHAAQQSRLELQRLYGEQDAAFTFTLPLCRGLR